MPAPPARLARLPRLTARGGVDVRCAATARARLLGLALLAPEVVAGAGLLLPRTRSVHTFGMRCALDLLWLDRDGRVVRVDLAVPPRRVRGCRAAAAVVELPAGAAQAWIGDASGSASPGRWDLDASSASSAAGSPR